MDSTARSGLDAQALARLADSIGPQNLIERLEQILETTGAARREMGAVAQGGNFRRVAEMAHAIKPDCADMGAEPLVRRLDALEIGVREQRLPEPMREVSAVLAELDEFLAEVLRQRNLRLRGPM